MQMLAQSFVVGKQESLVGLDRSSKSGAKLIALEGRRRALIKIIRSIECIIAEKFV